MRVLFDTHVLLWAMGDPETVNPEVMGLLAWPSRTRVVVSAASLWEIAIKKVKGKLNAPDNLPELLAANPAFEILPVTAEHAWAVTTLPDSLRHQDPFDRLLAAQAITEGLTLATRDRALLASGIAVMQA